jgi:hypothetical protein
LIDERKDLETKVYGTVSLGRGMIEDVMFSHQKEQEYEQRIEKLERKMKMLMMWSIRESGRYGVYGIYIFILQTLHLSQSEHTIAMKYRAVC